MNYLQRIFTLFCITLVGVLIGCTDPSIEITSEPPPAETAQEEVRPDPGEKERELKKRRREREARRREQEQLEIKRKEQAWAAFEKSQVKEKELQQRFEKLIVKWEEQTERIDALLDSWETKGVPGLE